MYLKQDSRYRFLPWQYFNLPFLCLGTTDFYQFFCTPTQTRIDTQIGVICPVGERMREEQGLCLHIYLETPMSKYTTISATKLLNTS